MVLFVWLVYNECGLEVVMVLGISFYFFFKGYEFKGLDVFEFFECLFLWIVFWSFCVMVGVGFVFLVLGFWGVYFWVRKKIDWLGFFYWLVIFLGLFGLVVVLMGWIIVEVGC